MVTSWVTSDRLSNAYEEGVEAFLVFVQTNLPADSNVIPCPCVVCKNLGHFPIKMVRYHLFANGFLESYKVWTFHGETHTNPHSSQTHETWDNPIFPPDCNDTKDMLRDAFGHVEKEEEEDPESLKSLIEECEKPFYPGSELNSLSGLLTYQHIKGEYGWSDASFDALLRALKATLPANNNVPGSIYEAKKLLKGVGLEYQKFHSCKYDCVVYRLEHKDATVCPKCGTSRWKEKSTTVPIKVFWYFPPIPRFKRMFASPDIAHDLTWHAQGRVNNGTLTHPRDAPAWKLVDETWKDFGEETRNIRLALSADGINPFKSLSSKHSCWPVTLVTYNLPPYLCMTRKFMMLTLLISGPKQPGNNIDVYLAPLIEDLKLLWETGVRTYDAYKKEYFNLRALLLWTINDFPAYGDLSGCVTKGYFACPICAENTCAEYLPASRKMCFLGHRRFLPLNHPYRKRKKDYNNEVEKGQMRRPKSGEQIFNTLEGFKTDWGLKGKRAKKELSKKKTQRKKKAKKEEEVIDERCKLWHKKSIFFELPYWKKLLVRHQLDVMHIEKNVCESIYGTLLNLPGKTKDGLKARQDIQSMGIKPDLQPEKRGVRDWLPPACYTLNTAEKKRFYDTLSNIKVPHGYCSNFKNLVSSDGSKMNGLKSNDCHVLMQQLLPFAIKGILNEDVRKTIISLCRFFNELCSKVIEVSKLDKLQRDIIVTLCLLEKYYPPSFFDVMIHLLVHLVQEVRLCGPVHFRWMYAFERYMKTLKGYVRNYNRPEGCIAECYVAEEALEFCTDYLKNMRSIGNPHERVDERIRTGKPLARAKTEVVDGKLLDQAHLYVIRNTEVLEPYIKRHMSELKEQNPRHSRNNTWLLSQHNKTFCSWLEKTVNDDRITKGEVIPEEVCWLAKGPSYTVTKYHGFAINEYTFHTKERDESRTTQSSGVSLVAHAMQVASAKDPNPVYGAVTYYGRINEIWDLDYHMFTVPVFMCDWVDTRAITKDDFGFTMVNLERLGSQSERFILATQAKQVFYVKDQQDEDLSVVGFTPHKMFKYGIGDSEAGDMLEFDAIGYVAQDLENVDDGFVCTRPDGEGILV